MSVGVSIMNSTNINKTSLATTGDITVNVTLPYMTSSMHIPMLPRNADASPTDLSLLLLDKEEQLASAHTSLVAVSLVLAFVVLVTIGAVGHRSWKIKPVNNPPRSKLQEPDDDWSGATVTSPDGIWSSVPQSDGGHVEMV